MLLEKDHIYHIYNQGNNRQKIYFNRENYFFFLEKMKEYILPYGDIMEWCLMPNHFHWMVYVKETLISVESDSVAINESVAISEGVTLSDALTKNLAKNPTKNTTNMRYRTFNDSIGLLLRSYTRAFNIQQNQTGSLFRKETKAECLTALNGITPSFFNTEFGTIINIPDPEKEYPQICFNYIHNNPVKAGLAKSAEDWEFSSYRDICGLRNGKIINKKRIDEFGLISSRGAI